MKVESTFKIKKGLAEMLKGGVIMDVVNAEQALIAEKSGAAAVMALERVPADIRAEGGVARMSSVETLEEIMSSVTVPVMAKSRIGHFVEAQMLEELGMKHVRANRIWRMSEDYLKWDGNDATKLFGIGKYGSDSYEIFYNNIIPENVQDKELKRYIKEECD